MSNDRKRLHHEHGRTYISDNQLPKRRIQSIDLAMQAPHSLSPRIFCQQAVSYWSSNSHTPLTTPQLSHALPTPGSSPGSSPSTHSIGLSGTYSQFTRCSLRSLKLLPGLCSPIVTFNLLDLISQELQSQTQLPGVEFMFVMVTGQPKPLSVRELRLVGCV